MRATVDLLDSGATVPFVARYRKEVTGGLDDAALRDLDERLAYLRELEQRRAAVLESVAPAGQADAELEAQIQAADTKARLEDVYLPFKPKRRTKAQIAREAGLEPLAPPLLDDPSLDPQPPRRGLRDARSPRRRGRARRRARDPRRAVRRGRRRRRRAARAALEPRTPVVARGAGPGGGGREVRRLFEHDEPLTGCPRTASWRCSAARRRACSTLTIEDPAEASPTRPPLAVRASGSPPRFAIADRGRAADRWLLDAVRWAWRTRILVHLDLDLRLRLRQVAEDEAVRVFAGNLRDLLLAAPAGMRPPWVSTRACAPASRSPSSTGPARSSRPRRSIRTCRTGAGTRRCAIADGAGREHRVELVAIGNGTASRETEKLAAELAARTPELPPTKVMVSRGRRLGLFGVGLRLAGAARASTSRCAARCRSRGGCRTRSPSWSRSTRSRSASGSTSTTSPGKLSRSLDAVVEDCVNGVGVDVNTASVPAAAPRVGHQRGRSPTPSSRTATRNGPFRSRTALQDGAAARARRPSSSAPASCASAAATTRSTPPACTPRPTRWCGGSSRDDGRDVAALIGNAAGARGARPQASSTTRSVCRPSATSSRELEKPGRDPRPEFRTASSPRASTSSPTSCRAWCWRGSSPTWRPSAPSSTSACTRTDSSTCRRCRRRSSRTRARWSSRLTS